jgi:predicted permease
MEWVRVFVNRGRSLFRAGKLDAELDEELRAHMEMAAEEHERRGMTADEARVAARRGMGGVTQVREQYRMQRGWPLVEQAGRDVRFGLRQLGKSPVFALSAVLTLALGIGANTAVFSVLNSVLLRPLAYPNADRLVRVLSVHNGATIGPSAPDARDFARANHTFEKLAVFDQWRKNVITAKTGDNPEETNVGLGPRELFEALGIEPILGRLFTEDEGTEGRNHVALIAESYWQSHYGRDRAILGRTITINSEPYTIVGVLPDALPGWLRGVDHDLEVWEPFLPTPDVWDESARGGRDYATVGLLKPGVSRAQAEADLKTIAANLAATHPIDRNWSVTVEPLAAARSGELRPQLLLLMGAVTLILLIACSNLAALLLARNTARQREFALRAALGAGRAALVRQILVETLLIALAGGGCGAALAWAIDFTIQRRHPAEIPQLGSVSLDWRVLGFTMAVSIGTGLVFGLGPAILNTRINFAESLKEGGRGSSTRTRHGFRKALVMGQIALALMLTAGAALLIQTIRRLENQQMGFRVDHLLKAHFFLPDAEYATPEAITRFCDTFAERLRGLPGVRDASVTAIYPPLEDWGMMFSIPGRPITRAEDVPWTYFGVTDAHYLKTAGIPLLRGRDFSESDQENAPAVALINDAFARKYFAGEDALGKRVLIGAPPNLALKDPLLPGAQVAVTVVGVIADSKNDGLERPVQPQVVTLYRQMPGVNFGFKEVIVRSETAPQTLEHAVEEQFHAIDPRLPLGEMAPMDEYIAHLDTDKRFTSAILTGFAALGLLLAVVGIYGVISYLVAQRTQELGIRLALGARRASVLWLIVRQGLALALAGVAIGLAGMALAAPSVAHVLYGVSAFDAATLCAVAVFLLAVAVAASALPARRAARIDPIRALRVE